MARKLAEIFQQRDAKLLVRRREELDDGRGHLGGEHVVGKVAGGVEHGGDRERGGGAELERLADLREDLPLDGRLGERFHHAGEVAEELFLLDGILQAEVVEEGDGLHQLVGEERAVVHELLRVVSLRGLRAEEALVVLEQHLGDVLRLAKLVGAPEGLAAVHLLNETAETPRVDGPGRTLGDGRPVSASILLGLVLIGHHEARVHDPRVAQGAAADAGEVGEEIEAAELPVEAVGDHDRRHRDAAVHELAVVGEEGHRRRHLAQAKREVLVALMGDGREVPEVLLEGHDRLGDHVDGELVALLHLEGLAKMKHVGMTRELQALRAVARRLDAHAVRLEVAHELEHGHRAPILLQGALMVGPTAERARVRLADVRGQSGAARPEQVAEASEHAHRAGGGGPLVTGPRAGE